MEEFIRIATLTLTRLKEAKASFRGGDKWGKGLVTALYRYGLVEAATKRGHLDFSHGEDLRDIFSYVSNTTADEAQRLEMMEQWLTGYGLPPCSN